MRFDCGDGGKARYQRLTNWHRHFALWPTRVADHDCRWLETVERKGTFHCGYHFYWSWEYRVIEKAQP